MEYSWLNWKLWLAVFIALLKRANPYLLPALLKPRGQWGQCLSPWRVLWYQKLFSVSTASSNHSSKGRCTRSMRAVFTTRFFSICARVSVSAELSFYYYLILLYNTVMLKQASNHRTALFYRSLSLNEILIAFFLSFFACRYTKISVFKSDAPENTSYCVSRQHWGYIAIMNNNQPARKPGGNSILKNTSESNNEIFNFNFHTRAL